MKHYKHLASVLNDILSSGDILNQGNRLQKLYDILFKLTIERNKSINNLKFDTSKRFYTSHVPKWLASNMLPRILDFIEKGLKLNFTSDIEFTDFVIIYGHKISMESISDLLMAYKYNKPVFFFEDNFITAVEDVKTPMLSLCFDHEGFYFDYQYAGVRNKKLNSNWQIKNEEKLVAEYIIDAIQKYAISKYNTMPAHDISFEYNNHIDSVILIVDQRYKDAAVSGAGADENTFRQMLKDAYDENPNSQIIIKTHPIKYDILPKNYAQNGYYDKLNDYPNNILKLHENVNPISLLQKVDKVYSVSSQMGFEAIICGKQVYCYGKSFYNGWGLTIDRSDGNYLRKKSRSLQELVYIYYTQNAYYFNPIEKKLCDIKGIIDYVIQHNCSEL